MSISIITINFNDDVGLEKTILSVIPKKINYSIEFIIIDGCSRDDSRLIINKYKEHIDKIIIEPDNGIYDAMNKGIAVSNQEFLIFMNSGDIFVDDFCFSRHKEYFSSKNILVGEWKNANGVNVPRISMLRKKMSLSHQAVIYPNLRKMHDLNFNFAADYDYTLYFFVNGYKFIDLKTIIAKVDDSGVSNNLLFKSALDSLKVNYKYYGKKYLLYNLIRVFYALARQVFVINLFRK